MRTGKNGNERPANSGRLLGRRIVITGAASGIGRATAQLFADEGAMTALFDRNGDGLKDVVQSHDSLAFQVDLTDAAAVQHAVSEAAKSLGGLDGLVNSAGIMLLGPTEDFEMAEWQATLDVNLTGTFTAAKYCIPFLKHVPGSTIVNVSSGSGLLPNTPGQVAYAASKGGQIALTRALAADVAPDIRVNCVCPGLVDTPMAQGKMGNFTRYALQRVAEPSEIATAILFLSSAESSYVTGATLAVDGGRTFH